MGKPIRWMAVADNHGDKQENAVCKVALQFAREWKPSVRIHLGDAYDFRALRRAATPEEKQEGLLTDCLAGNDFMAAYKPTVWLRGNHDERLWDVADGKVGKDEKLREYCKLIRDQIIGTVGDDCRVLPYDAREGVYRLGHLKAIHGYHAGITAARQAALVYGAVIMGHVHAIDEYPIPGLHPRVGRAIGGLCQLRMDYNRAVTASLRQAHGFAYGLSFDDGSYLFYQAREIGGNWHLPTEMKVYHA